MGNFTLYFTKGSQKKVGHHLERAHIDSKMSSGLLGAARTRIKPVIRPSRDFAYFVTHCQGPNYLWPKHLGPDHPEPDRPGSNCLGPNLPRIPLPPPTPLATTHQMEPGNQPTGFTIRIEEVHWGILVYQLGTLQNLKVFAFLLPLGLMVSITTEFLLKASSMRSSWSQSCKSDHELVLSNVHLCCAFKNQQLQFTLCVCAYRNHVMVFSENSGKLAKTLRIVLNPHVVFGIPKSLEMFFSVMLRGTC